MKTGTLAALITAVGIALSASAQTPNAQAARTYAWYAELASVDQTAKTLTVKLQIRDAVTRYVGDYKPGDKLMVTWVWVSGEADTVLYAPKYEVMKGIDEGFILPVEFVSADVAGKTMTVRAAASPSVLQALASVPAGRWIKVVTPMKQPAETAALTSAVTAEKPNLKPPPPPPMPPTDSGGRGRGGPPPDGGGRGRGGAPPDDGGRGRGGAPPDGAGRGRGGA